MKIFTYYFLFLLSVGFIGSAKANPMANNDSISVCSGSPVQINVLTNDAVSPGSLDATSIDLGPGSGKSITVIGKGDFKVDNSGVVTFNPVNNFVGTAITYYTVKDNLGIISNIDTIKVTIKRSPKIFSLQGGGLYCSGGSGIGLKLSGSETSVKYTLYLNGSSISTLKGTGFSLDFGNQSSPGTYTVLGTDTISGCTVGSNSPATVGVLPPPNTYDVGGGGVVCSSSTGAIITLSGSEIGITYQLETGGTLVGSPVSGTGSNLSFPPINSVSGNFTVTATNKSTACTTTMNGSALVTVYSNPIAFQVSRNGTLCSGSIGNDIQLSDSQIGIDYQLLLNGVPIGAIIPGTGVDIHFIGYTSVGVYTVTGTNSSGCITVMTDGAVISSIPKTYVLGNQPTEHYCAGGSGINLTLSNSEVSVKYQLLKNGLNLGSPINGTGSSLVFSSLLTGNYSVIASNSLSGCLSLPTDTVQIIADPIPTNYVLNTLPLNSTHYCVGSKGVKLSLSGSDIGTNYQLYKDGVIDSTLIAGNGNPINYDFRTAGKYYITQTLSSGAGPCYTINSDTITLIQDLIPTVYTFGVNPTEHYCSGTPGVNISLSTSDVSVNYQLVNNGVNVGGPIAGTGSSIVFGPLTMGSYSVIASNSFSGCSANPSDTVSVISDPAPINFTLTTMPNGTHYCKNDLGIKLILPGSEVGVEYQLYKDGVPDSALVVGDGNPINYDYRQSGTYYMTQTLVGGTGSCSSISTNSITLVQDSIIEFGFLTDTVHYCKGTSGAVLVLKGSELNVTYQIFNLTLGNTAGILQGTGGPLTFSNLMEGEYYIFASQKFGLACVDPFPYTALVIEDSIPQSFSLSPATSHYCKGGSGIVLTLDGSENQVDYQLVSGGNKIGSPITGTGLPLNFGTQPGGNYTVISTSKLLGCPGNSSNTALIEIDSLPTPYLLGAVDSNYCILDSGVHVVLSNSEIGVNYQLQLAGSLVGPLLAGTGSPLDFGLFKAGTYSVNAVNTITTCANTFASFTVVEVATPLPFALQVNNPHYCLGSGVDIKLSGSELGVTYQLIGDGFPVGSPLIGSGGVLDFSLQTLGKYWVMGIKSVGSCDIVVSDTVQIFQDPNPLDFSISGSPYYCPSTKGTSIVLSGSEIGANYQLLNSSGNVGNAQLGNGSSLQFDNLTTGSYNIQATNSGGCTALMNSGNPFQVLPPLSIRLGLKNINCLDTASGSIRVLATGGLSPYQYLWDNGKTDSVLSGLVVGNYSVTVTDALGCTLQVSGNLGKTNPPLATDFSTTTVLGTSVTINIDSLISQKDIGINLTATDLDVNTPGIQNSLLIPGQGQFTLDKNGKVVFTPDKIYLGSVSTRYIVTDSNGCASNAARLTITVQTSNDPNAALIIPTLFTPNGDGVDDDFTIIGLNQSKYADNTLEIFNRWGNQVFFAKGYLSSTPAWTASGLGDGTYFYLLKVNGIAKTYSGYITIIRARK